MPFSCAKNTKEIGVCTSCHAVDCKVVLDKCSVCGNNFLRLEIEPENYGDLQVEWLSYGSSRIGLISVSAVSSKIAAILRRIKEEPLKSNVRLIICGNKKISVQLLRAVDQTIDEDQLSEYEEEYTKTSAYSVFIDQEKNIFIILNENSDYLELLDEILVYFPSLYDNKINLQETMWVEMSLFFSNFVSKHMKKLSIAPQEIPPSEELVNYGTDFITDLISNIAEFYTFEETFDIAKSSSRRILLRKILDYSLKGISEKLKTKDFYASIFVVMQYFRLSLIVLAHCTNKALYNEMRENLLGAYEKLKNEYRQNKVLDCIAVILTDFAKLEISEQSHIDIEVLLKILENSLGLLDFSYPGSLIWLDIFDLFDYYAQLPDEKQISKEGYLWTLEQFIIFLRKTSEVSELHISYKLTLRNMWLTLILLVAKQKNDGFVAPNLLFDMAKVVSENVANFLMNENTLSQYAESGYKFEIYDQADDVLQVLYLAEAEGFTNVSQEMRDLFYSTARGRKLGHLEITLKWYDYLKTLNNSFLKDILTYDKYIEETNDHVFSTVSKMYIELAKGILDSDKWVTSFQEAEKLSLTYPVKDAVKSDTTKGKFGNLVTYLLSADIDASTHMVYQINAFSTLIKSKYTSNPVEKLSFLKECRANMILFIKGSIWRDTLSHLILIVDFLILLIKDDRDTIKQSLTEHNGELSKFPVLRDLLETFLNIKLQGTHKYRMELSKLLDFSTNVFEEEAINILIIKYKNVFSKLLGNSDAIVFLEGETDVAVYEEVYEKMGYQPTLRFLFVGGIDNFKTFAETKMIKELGIPAFYLTDGDVPLGEKGQRKKNKIMKELGVHGDHFMWIPRGAIDEYILEPHLICLGFPEFHLDERLLKRFIKDEKGKSGKDILETLFHTFMPGQAYTPENARKIALQFDKQNLPNDLIKIVEKVCSIAGLKI